VTALFRRVVNITVAPKTESAGGALAAIESTLGFELSNLDCQFQVKKSLKLEPNTCELKIFNLTQETRRTLETPKKLIVRLDAGYPDAVAQLYLGEVRSAHSHREGSDIITEISTGDSEKELATARINMSIGPKVSASVALMAICRELKVGIGNANVMAAKLQSKGVVFFGPGTVISGSAKRALVDFCRSADLECSIQDGVIQILDLGKALQDKAVYLSPETGLVGSPTIDNKGIVSVTAFIQPDLRPGRKIQIAAESVKGGFRIQDVEYTGDTAGNEWYAKMSAKAY
jgi:hypothetical protein